MKKFLFAFLIPTIAIASAIQTYQGLNGGGVNSFNSDSHASQTVGIGTSGTDFALTDDGVGGHVLNLPSASATARGVMSTGTQTVAGAKTFSGNHTLGGTCTMSASSGADILWSTAGGGHIGVPTGVTSTATDYRPGKIYVKDAIIVGSPGGLPPYGTNNVLVTGGIQVSNQSSVFPFFGASTFWNSVAMGEFAFMKDGSGTNAVAFINLDNVSDQNVYFSLIHRSSARTDHMKFEGATGNLTLLDGQLAVSTARTPASSSDTCTTGTINWDSGFVYVCVTTNTWKRAALSTW